MAHVIREVDDPRSWEAFFAVPQAVYGGDPRYLVPFRDAELESLRRPEFAGRQRLLVAVDGTRRIARLAARLSPALRDDGGRPFGLLGFFEARDDPPAVGALFREAVSWLKDRGAGPIVGPMDGDTWHRYRLNVGPWGEPPFLMEPYNPPYYPALWEANGFRVLEQYLSKRLDDVAGVAARFEPRYRAALAAGYRFEPLRRDRFADELRRLYRLSCEIFRDNRLYSEISEERFLGIYAGFRRLADPDFVTFAVAPDGSDAGFLFGFPDRFRAVAALGGRKGPVAALRFLWARRSPVDTVNLKSLGVVPAHRRSHLASALMACGYRAAREKGLARVNLCLILGGNPSGRLDAGLGQVLRRYHLYQLGEAAP
ncbi:MAG TPA: GNAT family N-acetyltransferase [Thermoanaerobaculia bacterium]